MKASARAAAWGGLLFVAFLCQAQFAVVPHQDDLGILDTGLNLIERGRYEEFAGDSHRGALGSVIYAVAFRAVGDVAGSRNLVAAAAASLTAALLLLFALRTGLRPAWLAPVLFAAFPFFSWSLNVSSVHLLQGAILVAGLLSFDLFAERPSPARSLLVGLLAGAGALVHPISLVFAPPLLIGLAVVTLRRGLSRRGKVVGLASAGAAFALVVGVQFALVAAASGHLGLSTQPFEVFSSWNPLHAQEGAGTPRARSYEDLAGVPAPPSFSAWIATMLGRPRFFAHYHLGPALAVAAREVRTKAMAWLWLPCLAVGAAATRRVPAMRRYGLVLLGCAALVGGVTTLVAEGRYWIPCLIASTPLAAAGLKRISDWARRLAGRVGGPTGLLARTAPGVVIGLVLVASIRASVLGTLAHAPWLLPVFRMGDFLASSPTAPPPGATVLTTTPYLEVWRRDLNWVRVDCDFFAGGESCKRAGKFAAGATFAVLEDCTKCDREPLWAFRGASHEIRLVRLTPVGSDAAPGPPG